MTVHLVKMAVGIESFEHLTDVQADRVRRAEETDGKGVLRHLTRNTPRRSDEVLDGGSIYWIIKGYIRAHQRITGFGEATGRNGRPRCALILDPKLVRTELLPHKPIQGWRYMEPAGVPEDLTSRAMEKTSLPDEMAAELRALGLL
ncbi:MAG: DUF1489 domain-containing protein [Rhodospirillaceae bacterium]|jgi:hypothetical protein|nr:DUF1489 domain-containing protein [Rhodospirillaceae bacterium]